jgi:hypothetical protein
MADRLVLPGVTLIDGSGSDPVENAVVVIEGSAIVAAGPAAEIRADPGGAGAGCGRSHRPAGHHRRALPPGRRVVP